MLEGGHDYQFIKFIVKNKYGEGDISTYNRKDEDKNPNKTETYFLETSSKIINIILGNLQ